jgi:D-glycero-alpha-D-manno-heptose-7-phosphate kinase
MRRGKIRPSLRQVGREILVGARGTHHKPWDCAGMRVGRKIIQSRAVLQFGAMPPGTSRLRSGRTLLFSKATLPFRGCADYNVVRKRMIIARSPLRISLGGGGTDLPSYYERFGGFLITAAIDKYVYITLHEIFVPEFIIKYSKLERVAKAEQIEHPIIREAFKAMDIDGGYLELTSMADIPAGTGLGSSGSFTTALLKALHAYKRNLIPNADIAEQACDIEINQLKEPVGKQDQYIAALGGITCFNFHKDGRVEAFPAKVSEETRYNLEDNLVMFFTGYSRSAGSILKDQHEKSKQDDKAMLENLHKTKEIGYASERALVTGELREFARLMDEHWQHKKSRSGGMSNPKINEWYDLARANGALGGKLIGAGGGGFLMFYAEENKSKLRHAMREAGLKEVRFRFDFEGTKLVSS